VQKLHVIFIYFNQASSPNAKRRSNSTTKHINVWGKTWNLTLLRNKAHGWWKWHQFPLNNFPGLGGGANCCPWILRPKVSFLTVVWNRYILCQTQKRFNFLQLYPPYCKTFLNCILMSLSNMVRDLQCLCNLFRPKSKIHFFKYHF